MSEIVFPRVTVIDLEEEKVSALDIDKNILKEYLGGRGLGTYLFYTLVRDVRNAVDPRNPLVFATGPLTGTNFPTSARSSLTSLSPLTNTISSSNIGGDWGPKLRKAGIDALIIKGAREKLTYIYIDNGEITFHDADKFKGMTTYQTEEALKKEFPKSAIVSIGPAGEKLVRYASITHDYEHDFGRGGLGAVMGSKKIKAIIVSGDKEIPISDPEGHKSLAKQMTRKLKKDRLYYEYNRSGTLFYMRIYQKNNGITINYYEENSNPGVENLTDDKFEPLLVKHNSCYKCPVACRHVYQIDSEMIRTPEFESVGILGANLGVFDLKTVLPLLEHVTALGMDTISSGQTLAALRHLIKKNKIGLDDPTGGKNDLETLKHVFDGVVNNDGEVFDLLRKGAKEIGDRYAPGEVAHVKGLEFPVYEPRKFTGQALGYGISPRGGCHLRGGATIAVEALGSPLKISNRTWQGKGRLVAKSTQIIALIDSAVTCVHAFYAYVEMNPITKLSPGVVNSLLTSNMPRIALNFLHAKPLSKTLQTVTGLKISSKELFTIGQRILTLERVINNNQGFTKKDDFLPEMFYEQGTPENKPLDKKKYERELLNYYKALGWNKEGIPTRRTLQKLGINA